MNKELEIVKELHLELDSVKKALVHLQNSSINCREIGLKQDYSEDELEKWEAFTARYSRLSDMVTQKIMNSILLIEGGNTGSLLDKANFAEKKNWVEKAEDFRQLRLLRNYIAHEYIKQNTNEIFELVVNNHSRLHAFVTNILNYCSNNPIYKI